MFCYRLAMRADESREVTTLEECDTNGGTEAWIFM
jgi:hypothetical protein